MWSCLRVENEQLNNFENYREIFVIPPVIDEQEESEIVQLKQILDWDNQLKIRLRLKILIKA